MDEDLKIIGGVLLMILGFLGGVTSMVLLAVWVAKSIGL